MNSSIRFWAVFLALLVLTAAPKVRVGSSDLVVIRREASETLATFLKGHGARDLQPLDVVSLPNWWTGWRFKVGGCPGSVMPAPPGGEMDATMKDLAGPGDATVYVFHGVVRKAPPGAGDAIDYVRARLMRSFNLGAQSDSFYVVLTYPRGCAAAASLPWRAL